MRIAVTGVDICMPQYSPYELPLKEITIRGIIEDSDSIQEGMFLEHITSNGIELLEDDSREDD